MKTVAGQSQESGNSKIVQIQPLWMPPSSIHPPSSASSQIKIPTPDQVLFVNTHIAPRPPATPRQVPRKTALRRAITALQRSKPHRPHLPNRRPTPFRWASEIFRYPPSCQQRWRTRPTHPARAPDQDASPDLFAELSKSSRVRNFQVLLDAYFEGLRPDSLNSLVESGMSPLAIV